MKSAFRTIIVWILKQEAKLVLKKYRPKIVAITGSVGKTSTKDAVYAVLAKKFHVRKSQKSFNSEIGLPLTILGLENAWSNPLRWFMNIFDGLMLVLFTGAYPEWLVLEVGADRPGDIRSLKSWLRVDVAVITRLPEVPVHVEFFDSAEAVVEEKASLIDALKRGGALLLYADDERTAKLQQRLPAPDARVILFGFSKEAEVRGEDFKLIKEEAKSLSESDRPTGESRFREWPIGMSARIVVGSESAPVEITGSLGPHSFLPAVAAAAVGEALGMQVGEIVAGLESYDPPPGRMRILPGLKNTLLIDDTYNSSPAAVMAALETLDMILDKSDLSKGRRIAALADMLELGRTSVEEHRKVGAKAAQTCNVLITVGFRARDIAQGALDAGLPDTNILQYEDATKAGEELKNLIKEGDCVLVKGSQSMRMERVVEELMLEPERAGDLLVRQDAEWKKR